jgi:hypothetical protein
MISIVLQGAFFGVLIGFYNRERQKPTPRFRTFQVCPKDLRAALRQAGGAED